MIERICFHNLWCRVSDMDGCQGTLVNKPTIVFFVWSLPLWQCILIAHTFASSSNCATITMALDEKGD